MLIIGCDYHPSFQQIAVFDPETGGRWQQRLNHNGEEYEKGEGDHWRHGKNPLRDNNTHQNTPRPAAQADVGHVLATGERGLKPLRGRSGRRVRAVRRPSSPRKR